MRIKICGLTNSEDAMTAAGFGADAAGFVLAAGKRQIELGLAASLARSLPPFMARVAVLVDPSEEEALHVVRSGAFTHLQLHGSESPEFCMRLPVPLLKAFRLATDQDAALLDRFMALAPSVTPLLDSAQGGSGLVCDWVLAERAARRYGIVLAGGLSPLNVADGIRRVRPQAVDVSSGVEATPGKKDPALVQSFVAAARAASG